jgi:hypothetical protein
MKAKKAEKRLNKAKQLLSSVIDQYASEKSIVGTRDLLHAAVSNIDQAQASIKGTSTKGTSTVPAAQTPTAGGVGEVTAKQSRKLSAEGRRRLSLSAKKRWAAAKRKGARTLAAASPK